MKAPQQIAVATPVQQATATPAVAATAQGQPQVVAKKEGKRVKEVDFEDEEGELSFAKILPPQTRNVSKYFDQGITSRISTSLIHQCML